MAKTTTSKSIAIKFIGGGRATETVILTPGTTTHDLLTKLGLGTGYQLSDARSPEKVFGLTDVLYAMVEDGDLLHASALVDAGMV